MPLSRPLVRLVCAAAVVSGLWILANARKAVHVDDAFFLLWARTIAPMTGESPATQVNWIRFEQPLSDEAAHYATGWPLVLAAMRHRVGDAEVPLHLLQWPFATMFLAGCGLLAETFAVPIWPAFLLCATSPLFLLPAATIMADLPCLGPGVLGLALWIRGGSGLVRLAAMALIVLAGQMKQSILPLFPLLVLGRDGRIAREPLTWLAAVVTGAAAGRYPDVPPHAVGDNTTVDHVLWILPWASNPGLLTLRFGYLASVVAALAVFPAGWLVALAFRREAGGPMAKLKALGAGLLVIALLAQAGCWQRLLTGEGVVAGVPGDRNEAWFYGAIIAAFGWGWFALRPAILRSPWLAAWLGLATVGYMIGTPFPAARFLIPLLPPLVLVFLDDLRTAGSRRLWVAGLAVAAAGNLWLSIGLAASDGVYAGFCRDAAARGGRAAASRHLPLLTTGSWGLRHYVERAGGRVLGSSADPLRGGAVMLEPARADHRTLPMALRRRSRVAAVWTAARPSWWQRAFPACTLPPPRTAASFHGGCYWFPYAFSRGPAEQVTVRVIRPAR
jgi:hypothetical protein